MLHNPSSRVVGGDDHSISQPHTSPCGTDSCRELVTQPSLERPMTTKIWSDTIWLQFPETKIRQEKFRIHFRCPKKIGAGPESGSEKNLGDSAPAAESRHRLCLWKSEGCLSSFTERRLKVPSPPYPTPWSPLIPSPCSCFSLISRMEQRKARSDPG